MARREPNEFRMALGARLRDARLRAGYKTPGMFALALAEMKVVTQRGEVASRRWVAGLERRTLSYAEAVRLLENVKGDRLEALFVLALYVGLRQSELLGLRWSDVELPGLMGALPTQPVTNQPRPRTPDTPIIDSLVFATPTGQPFNASALTRRFHRLAREAGVPEIRFHSLRHTAASLFIARGVDLRTVMQLLGHSTIATTADVYAHVPDATMRDAARRLEDWRSG